MRPSRVITLKQESVEAFFKMTLTFRRTELESYFYFTACKHFVYLV